MVSVLQKSAFLAVSVLCCVSRGVLTIKISVDVPDKVALGGSAQLKCDYDLEGGDLLFLKWYKDNEEFYQLEMGSQPHVRFNPLPGVEVDHSKLSRGSVYIKDVTNSTAGVYRCEVSVGRPIFKIGTDEKTLSVEDVKITSKEIDTGDAFNRSFESKSGQPAERSYQCQEQLLSLLAAQQLQKPMLEERTCLL